MRYYQEISHMGLNKHRLISDTDQGVLAAKVRQQLTKWDEEWHRKCEAEREKEERRKAKEDERREKEAGRRQAEREKATKRREKEEQQRRQEEVLLGEKEQAANRTARAQAALDTLRHLLHGAVEQEHAIAWESMLDKRPFPEAPPTQPQPPAAPRDASYDLPAPQKRRIDEPERPVAPSKPPDLRLPPRPVRNMPVFRPPDADILDKIVPGRRAKRVAHAETTHQTLLARVESTHAENIRKWQTFCESATARHRKLLREHEARLADLNNNYLSAVARYNERSAQAEAEWQEAMSHYWETVEQEDNKRQIAHEQRLAEHEADWQQILLEWQKRRDSFLAEQSQRNEGVLEFRRRYYAGERDAVLDYFRLVLARSDYPFLVSPEVTLEYLPEPQILLLDFGLPLVEDLPTLKEVRFVQSRKEFAESHLSERDTAKQYDAVLYQLAIRTVYEVYDADVANRVASVVFNGWTTTIDKATGKPTTACIMSLQTVREAFLDRDFLELDAKECFRKLKGIAAPQLHTFTPVAPVLSIARDDRRFVASHEVAAALDEGTNLAAMDWEEFEHLIRELFEKEFAEAGGEVRVTQASRDGGVDAIIFDPDPIRGGKIVIQAKRYTNVVSVSAVRDLYGTVLNEGATKGILVCTSDYGADAHQFAQGKPITLLNGSHLLHLLERHGHKAKIDIPEARRILSASGPEGESLS